VNPSEAEFRCVESKLDALVSDAEQALRLVEVQVEDVSRRTYHYKNEYLCWSYSFLKEWLVDVEKARVTIRITYGEPTDVRETPEVEFSWRAELFQQGQVSRIEKKGGFKRALLDVEQQGIAILVKGAISECEAYLPRVR